MSAMCFIPVTFDPKAIFGKIRAPVKVTLNGVLFYAAPSRRWITCIPYEGATGRRRAERRRTMAVTIALDTSQDVGAGGSQKALRVMPLEDGSRSATRNGAKQSTNQ